MSGEGRATIPPYAHAKRIETLGQGRASIPVAVLGANIEVHVGALLRRWPSPMCECGVEGVGRFIEGLVLPSRFRYSFPVCDLFGCLLLGGNLPWER